MSSALLVSLIIWKLVALSACYARRDGQGHVACVGNEPVYPPCTVAVESVFVDLEPFGTVSDPLLQRSVNQFTFKPSHNRSRGIVHLGHVNHDRSLTVSD